MLERHREHLYQQILQAREEERKQIARELHDQIIQALVGLSYHLSNVRTLPSSEVDERLAQVQSDLRRILDDVRQICADLRPTVLQKLGLVAAVRAHIREIEDRSPFQIALLVEGDVEQSLTEDIELCLFRITQEALANVQKHADARQVVVRLLFSPHELTVTVQDNGKGFDVPALLDQLLDEQHFGLVGMRERLKLVYGTLRVVSTRGRGTCVYAWAPRHHLIPRRIEGDERAEP